MFDVLRRRRRRLHDELSGNFCSSLGILNVNDVTVYIHLTWNLKFDLLSNTICIICFSIYPHSLHLFFPSFRLHPLIYPSIHPPSLSPPSLSLWLCTMHPNDPPKPVKRCLWVRFTHPHSLCFASLYDGKAQNICCFCSGLRHFVQRGGRMPPTEPT